MNLVKLTINYHTETKALEVDENAVVLDVVKTLFLAQDMTAERFVDEFVLKSEDCVVDPRSKVGECKCLVLELVRRDVDGEYGGGAVPDAHVEITDHELNNTANSDVATRAHDANNAEHEPVLEYDTSLPEAVFCGLSNIGNTCFMNTAVQCLINLPLFTTFFLTGEYLKWINTENKLGYKGEVARLWQQLVSELFSNKKVVKAYGFKATLGKLTSKFVDFEEQDTAEFINTVLDCLHEDLRIRGGVFERMFKMYSIKIDFESISGTSAAGVQAEVIEGNYTDKQPFISKDHDRSDAQDHAPAFKKAKKGEVHEVLQRYFSWSGNEQHDVDWHEYLKNNTSIVSMLFSGKLLSMLECLNCRTVSKKYELFTSLSLNIPEKRNSVFLVFDSDFKVPIRVPIELSWNVHGLKKILKYEYQIQRELVVVAVNNGVVERTYSDDDRLAEGLYCYEYDPSQEYFWLRIRVANYIILNSYLDFVFLVRRSENMAQNYLRVVRKLKPLMRKDLDFDCGSWSKIFDLVQSSKPAGCKNFAVMTMMLKLNLFHHLFGKNFSMKAYLKHKRDLDLDDCIQAFESKEYLLGANNVYCAKCESNQDHSKEFTIHRSPKYFILHFKRLSYEKGYCNKINTFVDFKEECVIKGESYQLQGVCNHIEIAMSSGHYTATVRKNGDLYCFNDSCITKIEHLVKENAYVLFYTRQ